jgi:ABC-2 type transport system ATP-binding protein
VEELRERGAGERQRVRVEVAGGQLGAIPGTTVVQPLPNGAVLAPADGVTPDAVLDAARAAGTVTHFSLQRPTLAELYREAVAA